MRVPLSWLRELVAWHGTVPALTERLTMAGLEVSSVEDVGRLDARIRVGRLVAVEPHPQADRLHVCKVEVGEKSARTLVSGAPDLRPGRVVPVALPGARLPGGREVAAVELRGVRSDGVVCSEAELDLGDDATGLLELPADAAPGTPLVELAGVADTVLDLEVTPNRGDCLSVLGIAREVAALTGARLRHPRPRPRESGAPASREVRVQITASDLCPRYCARVVRGVTIGPSPFTVRLRLRRAGMRPINNVVDASNYVMLERGQPLHAFDLERIAEGRIVVRRAAAGERITTLDAVERLLDGDDLVIADARSAVAIAGVMGGQDSEVRPDTRTLLLESAFFTPGTVRRTGRRLGLMSQAAYRFERRVDPAMVPEAIDALAAMLVRHAGGRVAPGVVEGAPAAKEARPATVQVRPRRVAAVLGAPVSRAEITRRLRALGVRCRPQGDVLLAVPPSYRGDLALEEDVIEEVARVGGYDKVPVTLPVGPLVSGAEGETRALLRRVRGLLLAEGLAEMVTLSFTDPETNRRLPGFVGRELAPLALKNPISSEMGELRRSPLAGLLRALRLNTGRTVAFVGAFELGKGYGVDRQGARREPRAVSVLLAGNWPPRGAEQAGPPVDFFDLKGIIANLQAGLGIADERVAWRPVGETAFLHPGQAAVIEVDGQPLGVAGALHPEIVQAADLTGEVLVAELDFTELGAYVPRRVSPRPLPRFPAITRDMAVIVDEAFRAGDIVEEVRALGQPQIESVRMFDCYRGAPIAPGKKSLAYTVAYRVPDRTLTDDEVNALHAMVLERLAGRFALEFRT